MKSLKFRRILALSKKEFIQVIRDPGCILIAFILPLILLFIYGYGISLDVTQMKTGIVLEDNSPNTQTLVNAFKDSRFFNVEIESREEVFDKIAFGKLQGAIVIPSYFSEFLERGVEPAPIQVIADGSSPNTANIFQNYARGTWLNWEKVRIVSHPSGKGLISFAPRIWYNQELDSHYFIIPGSIAIIMALIGTLLTSFVVAREWERGTMEALLSTPVTVGEILLSKLIPYFILGMSAMFICAFLAVFFFRVPFRGSITALFFLSSVFMLASLASGLLISTLSRNQFVASQAAIVSAYLPAFMLSGFIFEIQSMPAPIRAVTYLLPARYVVSSFQTIFLAGDVGAILIPDFFALLLISCVLFLIIKKISRSRLD